MPPWTWIHVFALATAASAASSAAPAAARAASPTSGWSTLTAAASTPAGGLGADEHVRAEVLDRLERADRPAELVPALRVVDREAARRGGDADAERAGSRTMVAGPPLGRVGVDRSAVGQFRDDGERRQRVE